MKEKSKESYMDIATKAISEATMSSDESAKKTADSAINTINEIIKRIKSGSITPQQAEDETRGIIISVSEIPGLSQSNIAALRIVAAKEDATAKAKEEADTYILPIRSNMQTPQKKDDQKPSKFSEFIRKVQELANKMMSSFTVVMTESPELGKLHPETTPGQRAPGQKQSKAKQ